MPEESYTQGGHLYLLQVDGLEDSTISCFSAHLRAEDSLTWSSNVPKVNGFHVVKKGIGVHSKDRLILNKIRSFKWVGEEITE